MAKYTGSKGKLVRRFGVNIFENPKYDRLLERRSHAPGQHGQNKQRRKISDYGKQLVEKQKLRYTYGLMEKQFRRLFRKAQQMPGVTGENLLMLLETRLDTLTLRAGFGSTLAQARQMVNHGHITVNGRRVDIPSYRVQVGDIIGIREKNRSKVMAIRYLEESRRYQEESWFKVDKKTQTVTVERLPQRSEINSYAKEQLVVELYSK